MSDNKDSMVGGAKQAWKNPKARKGMLISGGVVAIVLVVSFGMLHKKSQQQTAPSVPAAASITPPGSATTGDQLSSTSEKYKEMVRENDQKRADDAANTPGQMVLPKISGLTDPNVAPPAGPAMTADVMRQNQQLQQANGNVQQSNQVKPITPQDVARSSPSYVAVVKLLSDEVAKAMGQETSWNPLKPPAPVAASQTATQNGAQQIASANGVVASAANVQGNSTSLKPIIAMGETYFATLDTAINTDYSGPVIATIRQGKFNGARLAGTKTLENDAVVIKFAALSPSNGDASIPISAYAITIADAKQFGLTGLQGSTDYHVVQRYLLPAAMAFVSGYGQAASQQAQTVVSNSSGTVQNTSPLMTKDRLFTAAGNAVQPIAADLQKASQRQITISMNSGTEIGVMFASDVVAAKGTQTGAIPAAPQSIDQQIAQQQLQQQIQQLQQLQQQQQSLQQQQQNVVRPIQRQSNVYGQQY